MPGNACWQIRAFAPDGNASCLIQIRKVFCPDRQIVFERDDIVLMIFDLFI